MRYETKRLIVWAMHFVTWPLGQPARLAHRLGSSESLFDFSAKLLSLVPGVIGQYLRASFYMQTLSECHYDLSVSFGSFFSHPTARVGSAVYVGSYSIIGTAELGNGVVIASQASILSGRHQHGSAVAPGMVTDPVYTMVRIGADTWIGEGAIVMASIGRRCIVGAGSVVSKPVPDDSVAVGNPARLLARSGQQSEA